MKTPLSFFLSGALFLFGILLHSQSLKPVIDQSKAHGSAVKSGTMVAPLKGIVGAQTMDTEWMPVLTHKVPGHEAPENEDLENIKALKTIEKFSNPNPIPLGPQETMMGITPTIGANFIGNTGTGFCPLDNTIAISNGGIIVSLINSNICYFNTIGTQTFSSDLWTFYGDGSLASFVCDPKVIYDSGADRFVLYGQTCDGISANSTVIICFSKTNDPAAGWWRYELTGNPLSDGSWFDYPKLGVSNNEIYVTGNLFAEGSNAYNQSVVYQIEKAGGYAGGSLTWQFWSGIPGNPFTLLPLSNGQQGNYGPGIYLASVDASGSSTIHFYDLTDDMSASGEALNHFPISTTTYSVGGAAAQSGGANLDNGDNRTQSGFYLNGTAHFVFCSDIGGGWNGINYNRINVGGLSNTSTTFGQSGSSFDLCYPSVASCGMDANDKSVMITYEKSGASIFPGTRVISCDDGLNWSVPIIVQDGIGFVNTCGGIPERWGDYTGICRKMNTTNTVWVSGAYGNSSNGWNTWIAEIVGTGVGVEENGNLTSLNLYPNPVIENFQTEISLIKTEEIKIKIIDIQGKVVKELFKGIGLSGENIFTFNKGNLSDGAYFLQIESINNQIIKNEKFIVGN